MGQDVCGRQGCLVQRALGRALLLEHSPMSCVPVPAAIQSTALWLLEIGLQGKMKHFCWRNPILYQKSFSSFTGSGLKKKKKSGQAAQDQEAWGSISQSSAGAGAQQKQLLTLAEHGHLLLTSRASVSPSLEATPRRYSCVCLFRQCGALMFRDVQGLSYLLQLRPLADREHIHECDQSKNCASWKLFPHPCTLLLFFLKTANTWVCVGWPPSLTIRRESPKTREQARAMVALGYSECYQETRDIGHMSSTGVGDGNKSS